MRSTLRLFLLLWLCVEPTIAETATAARMGEHVDDIMSSMPFFSHPQSAGVEVKQHVSSLLKPPVFAQLRSGLEQVLKHYQEKYVKETYPETRDQMFEQFISFLDQPNWDRGQQYANLLKLTYKNWTPLQSAMRKASSQYSSTFNTFLTQLDKRTESPVHIDPALFLPPLVGQGRQGLANIDLSDHQVTSTSDTIANVRLVASQSSDCAMCSDSTAPCHYLNISRICVRWFLLSLGLMILIDSFLDDRSKCFDVSTVFSTAAGTLTEVSDIGLDLVGPADQAVGAQSMGMLVTFIAIYYQWKEWNDKSDPWDKVLPGDKLWAKFDTADCPSIVHDAYGMSKVQAPLGLSGDEGKDGVKGDKDGDNDGDKGEQKDNELGEVFPIIVRSIQKKVRSVTKNCRGTSKVSLLLAPIQDSSVNGILSESSDSKPKSVSDSTLSMFGSDQEKMTEDIANLNPYWETDTLPVLIADWCDTKQSSKYMLGRGGPGCLAVVRSGGLETLDHKDKDQVLLDFAKISVLRNPRLLTDAADSIADIFKGITNTRAASLLDCSKECPYGVPAIERMLPHRDLCIQANSISPQCGFISPNAIDWSIPIVRAGTQVKLGHIEKVDVYDKRSLLEILELDHDFTSNNKLTTGGTIEQMGHVVEVMAKKFDHKYLIAVPGTSLDGSGDKVPVNYYIQLAIDQIKEAGHLAPGQRKTIMNLWRFLVVAGILFVAIPGVMGASDVSWVYMPLMGLYGALLGFSFTYIIRSRDFECRESWGKGAGFVVSLGFSAAFNTFVFMTVYFIVGAVFMTSHWG